MTTLEERIRLSRALNDIDLAVHAKLGFDEIMQAALGGFVNALGADAGDIKQFDGSQWVVTFQHGFGPGTVGLHLDVPDAPVAERVAKSRGPVTVTDYLAEPPDFYVGFPFIHKLRAALAVPLIVRGDVVGCLFSWMRDRPRAFTEGEIDFGRRVAASVALAVENARLLEAEQRARQVAETTELRLHDELERTQILLRSSHELSSAESMDELLGRLARIVMDATGIDRVFINLVDMSRHLLTPKIATGGLRSPRGAEIEFERLSETSQAAIFGSKTTVLDYELPGMPRADREIAEANRSKLVLFVPLMHQGEVIGHIALDEPDRRCDFSAEQIEMVESIAAQAAVVVQNVRLFEREHRIAETLQTAILSPPEQIEGLESAWLYRPASAASHVGGDFYDLFALDGTRAALLVGDVSGKGIDAAQLTTLVRDGARAYLLQGDEPDTVFEKLNALTHRFTPTEKFATAFLGVLDCATGALAHCGAGHPSPIVVGRAGVRALKSQPGILGAFEDACFPVAQTAIAPGETIVLFTDGLTEARCGMEMLGEAGVFAALGRIAGTGINDLPGALIKEALEFSNGRLRDDVVILCVSRLPEASS